MNSIPPAGENQAFLSSLERQVIDVFVDAVKVIGLPKSLGEIYGLLFFSPDALSLDDVVRKLRLSKGSASQGLRMLRELGAVKEAEANGSRRTLYEPDVDLKRLVGGFIREQVRPHLESGKGKVVKLMKHAGTEENEALQKFYKRRLKKLDSWVSRGRVVLPIIQRMLGE
ncbi:MAG: GbsR/MarR family transcriptional regulator [Akkermansiaceae bacterium]